MLGRSLAKASSLVVLLAMTVSFQCEARGDKEKGKEIYQTCIECHGDRGLGNKEKNAPRIAGQFDWYIEKSIHDFKTNTERKNPEMYPFIEKLSDQDIEDVAAYVSAMK